MLSKLFERLLKGLLRLPLPECMKSSYGTPAVCPRYWFLKRMGARTLWNRVLWILCRKEIEKRVMDRQHTKDF